MSQFLSKLEDRVLEVIEEMETGDLVLILTQIARRKRRNVPMLKSLCFYISKNKNMLDIKQLSDTLFALNQLSFRVSDLIIWIEIPNYYCVSGPEHSGECCQ